MNDQLPYEPPSGWAVDRVDPRVNDESDIAHREEWHRLAAHLTWRRDASGASLPVTERAREALLLIRSGRANLHGRALDGREIVLLDIGPGDVLDLAAIDDVGPSARIEAVTELESAILTGAPLARVRDEHPAACAALRADAAISSRTIFLRRASPFAHLPTLAIRDLAARAITERVPAGTVVVHEGEIGDRFYVVAAGRLSVQQRGRHLRDLGTGDFFGEIALLAAATRTATVIATEDCALVVLRRVDFATVVERHGAIRRQMREIIRIRAGEALARAVASVDALEPLMPGTSPRTRGRYWRILAGGIVLFASLSFAASRFEFAPLTFAVITIGSLLGPFVYVRFLADTQVLPERPAHLVLTAIVAAGLGIPLAYVLETWLETSSGGLAAAFAVALVEESAKILGVAWFLGSGRGGRLRGDGLVYGAAAGMGFAALENLLYAWRYSSAMGDLIGTLWMRTLLAPFGHGTWTAIVCAAIWGAHDRPIRDRVRAIGLALALSVGLHTLWNWQPLPSAWVMPWFVLIGAAGLEALRSIAMRAHREAVTAALALNPDLALESGGDLVACRACREMSPRGSRYCVRCGAAIRAG